MAKNETGSVLDRPIRAANFGRITLAAAALALLTVLGVGMVFGFADNERERDLRTWQTRLGIIAETRATAVADWVGAQFGELRGLAQNTSLQLYMTELTRAGDAGGEGRVTVALAQSGYLRNLLTVTASRSNFATPPKGPDVNANVNRIGLAGIAIVAGDGRIVVATEGMPAIEGRLKEFIANAPAGETAMQDMYVGAGGSPTMAFSVPVFTVQGQGTTEIGRIVGVKEVAAELYPLLKQPGTAWDSAEALLVRRNGAMVEYLSPALDGGKPLERKFAFDTPGLASAFAISKPGGFAVRRDYADNEVLLTSRPIAATSWHLVYKIARADALGASDARVQWLITVFLLVIAVGAVAIIAAWRHGSSLLATRAAGEFEDMALRHQAQSMVLKLVTDNQPGAMFIVDTDGVYHFANRAAARGTGIGSADMIGKTMDAVIGPGAAKRYERANRDALLTGRIQHEEHRIGTNGDLRVVQSDHVPVRASVRLPAGVMVVEEDITDAVIERERRERTLEQLVETLITMADRRDPMAANHSARVAAVSRDVAGEMGLEPILVRTAELAGRLMNLGKLLVPAEVLNFAGALDERRIRQVRAGIQMSADLLAGVEFEGPVAETLRQIQERWDGEGTPVGLLGEQILITARIVSAANAFVALTSDRAHRGGMDSDAAAAAMMAEVGKSFERRVVAALLNLMDNRGDAPAWAEPSITTMHT